MAIVNSAAMNIGMHVSFQTMFFFRYMPRSGIAGSCGNSIFSFLVFKVKNLPAMQETRVGSLGQEDPLEKGMAVHSSILAWRIPWT